MWLVWAIDDCEDNLEMVRDSLLPHFEEYVRVECFLSPKTAVREIRERRDRAGELPHVILMDYFLGVAYGSEVTREIRTIFGSEPGPVVVGHSSSPAASRAIVEAGGDFVLPKRPGAGISRPLHDLFADRARVAEWVGMRRRG